MRRGEISLYFDFCKAEVELLIFCTLLRFNKMSKFKKSYYCHRYLITNWQDYHQKLHAYLQLPGGVNHE